MADTDDMIDITQGKFEQLIRKDGSSVGKSEQGVIREHGAQAHSPGMKDCLMTETA